MYDDPEFCSRLRRISYDYSNDEIVSAISKHCHNLIHVDISEPQTMNTNVCYPELLHLDLFSVDHDDMRLLALFEQLRKVQTLNISFSEMTEFTVAKAFECFRDLRSFIIYGPSITTQSLRGLTINCLLLEELKLHHVFISQEDSDQFSRQCSFPQLRIFHSSDINISDQFILELSQKSPILKELHLYFFEDSPSITEAGMCHIASHCRNLSDLNLFGLANVTSPDCLVDILTNNPRIRKSNFNFGLYNTKAPLIHANNSTDSFDYVAKLQDILDSRP